MNVSGFTIINAVLHKQHLNPITDIYYFTGETYWALLRVNGQFMNVSGPAWRFPQINPLTMLPSQVSISGSAAGSRKEMQDMLNFAAEHNVKPWIQKYPMKDIN